MITRSAVYMITSSEVYMITFLSHLIASPPPTQPPPSYFIDSFCFGHR